MKNTLTLGILILLSFTFCKKKDSSPAATTPPSNNTTGSTGSTTGNSSNYGAICNLQTTKSVTNYNGILALDSFVIASFFATPITTVIPAYVPAGTVSLNGNVIPYSNSYYSITNNLNFSISNNLNWNVSGSGTLTAFSHSYTPSYPKYTGGNLLPDTCVKANGLSFTINGVSNYTGLNINVLIYTNGASLTKIVPSNGGVVTITSAELASFPTNNLFFILMNLGNYTTTNFGGLTQTYSNTLQYSKYCYLK